MEEEGWRRRRRDDYNNQHYWWRDVNDGNDDDDDNVVKGVVHANVGHNVTLFNDGRMAVSYHFSTYERCDNQP
jgi:hypothetical protein